MNFWAFLAFLTFTVVWKIYLVPVFVQGLRIHIDKQKVERPIEYELGYLVLPPALPFYHLVENGMQLLLGYTKDDVVGNQFPQVAGNAHISLREYVNGYTQMAAIVYNLF